MSLSRHDDRKDRNQIREEMLKEIVYRIRDPLRLALCAVWREGFESDRSMPPRNAEDKMWATVDRMVEEFSRRPVVK